jgi:uncharacterized membrane protein YcfT
MILWDLWNYFMGLFLKDLIKFIWRYFVQEMEYFHFIFLFWGNGVIILFDIIIIIMGFVNGIVMDIKWNMDQVGEGVNNKYTYS